MGQYRAAATIAVAGIGAPIFPDQRARVARLTAEGEQKLAEVAPERSDDWRSLGVSILHRLVVDTLLSAPIAVGVGTDFAYNGKKWNFSTPRGRRPVARCPSRRCGAPRPAEEVLAGPQRHVVRGLVAPAACIARRWADVASALARAPSLRPMRKM